LKVLILAGEYGTRLSEETNLKPKPMVEIGGYSFHHLIYIWSVLVDRLFVRDARTDYDASNTLCSNIHLPHFLRRY